MSETIALPPRAIGRVGGAGLRHDAQVTAVAFLDASRLVSAGQDERLRIWSVPDGRLLADAPSEAVLCLAVSPDGAWIAASGDPRVHVFDASTLARVAVWDAAMAPCSALAFGRAGIAVAAFDGSVAVYARDGQEICRPIETGPPALALQWSNDRELLVTREDGTLVAVRVDAPGVRVVTELPNARPLLALAVAHDGARAYVGGCAPEVAVVALDESGAKTSRAHSAGDRAHSLAVSASAPLLAVGGSAATLLSLDEVSPPRVLPLATGGGSRVAISPDGATLAVGASTGRISLWDPRRCERLSTSPGPDDDLLCLAFSPDGSVLAAAGLDGAIYVASGSDASQREALAGHGAAQHVRALAFADNARLVSGGADGTLRVWDLPSGREKQCVGVGSVRSIALDRSATVAFVGTESGDLVRVSLRDGATRRVAAHKQAITGVFVIPDGSAVITASRDRALRFWDAEQLVERRKVNVTATAAALSPDGSVLAAVGFGEPLRLWDTRHWLERRTLAALSVQALAFSPDGTRLATGGGDATVRVWDVATREIVDTFSGHTGREVRALAYSPDGSRLASGGSDLTALLWDTSPTAR